MTHIKAENVAFHASDSGTVAVREATVPAAIGVGTQGVQFGPLELRPYRNTKILIDNFTYDVGEKASLWPFTTATGVGTAAGLGMVGKAEHDTDEEDEQPIGRREFLAAAGTLLAGAGVARAAEETHNVASFSHIDNPRGTQLRIIDKVSDYLPRDATYFVDVDGTSKGNFDADGGSLTIGPGIAGDVELSSDDALAFWEEIVKKVRTDDTLEYTLRHDRPLNEESTDEEIVLSSQSVVVDPIVDAGPSETLVEADGTTIPHADDGGSAGNWYVRDETALVYQVGPDAPSTDLVTLTINIGHIDQAQRKYF